MYFTMFPSDPVAIFFTEMLVMMGWLSLVKALWAGWHMPGNKYNIKGETLSTVIPTIYGSDSQTVCRKRCAANIMKVYFKNEKKPICIEIFIHRLKYINIF
jgi:hypothetical protein